MSYHLARTLEAHGWKIFHVIRESDGATIPIDAPGNMDTRDFLAWNAQQETPLPTSGTYISPEDQAELDARAAAANESSQNGQGE